MCTTYAMDTCIETIEKLAFVMEVYSRNIPGICKFLVYGRHIPSIFQTYDSIQTRIPAVIRVTITLSPPCITSLMMRPDQS